MATIDELRKARIEKLSKLKKLGIDPYPATVPRTDTISRARQMIGSEAAIAGRIVGLRGHGKIYFLDIEDESGTMQAVIKADTCEKKAFSLVEHVDLGDFLALEGKVDKTQAGEISVFAKSLMLISKALRPLPGEFQGFKDKEERYRQRYVDLLVNKDIREIFRTRTKIIQILRTFLDKHGFLEVETPVLQPIYGGASAKPFVTHHNTLDTDFYLRISDELYLKRLIVAGFEKVYEFGHDFRNEGMDRGHNPEFTMLEFYWAYADYETLMRFTEEMVVLLLRQIHKTVRIKYEVHALDFTAPWKRMTYREAVLEYSGIDIDKADSEEGLRAAIGKRGIGIDLTAAVGYGAVLDALYKQTTRPKLIGPLFLTQRPTAFVSLAKRMPQDPRYTASFQLLVAGEELVNAYNELNDPIDQANRWKESEKLGKKGSAEHEAFDDDYIRALEYGMPPTAGWGMGIDRLVAVLTNQHSIKDVMLFPALRPQKK